VVVLGGGLAGITAALDCAAAGAEVTLVEVRRRLGGAAYSFERQDLHMDNGQHVFLRCCLAYRSLLARLGSEGGTWVQPRLEIPVLKPGHPPAMLRRGALPAPAHLLGALARYPHLRPSQRLAAMRAAFGLMRLRADDERLDSSTFGGWLARHGQGPAAVDALWDLIALPTLNLPAAEASLALAAFVFRTGLLTAPDAGDIGFHRATLSETIGEPARRALGEAGVRVRLGWRAEGIVRTADGLEVHGGGARGASPSRDASSSQMDAQMDAGGGDPREGGGSGPAGVAGDGLSAEAVVVAVAHTRAASLLEPLLGQPARALRGLGASPIVNLHVVYDRTVCEHRFAAGVGTPVQYVFDRTSSVSAALPAGSQYLAVSLSGARREMGMSVDELRERYLPALGELFGRAREAKVERFLVTREHAATFRAAPGVASIRLGPLTTVPGLVLAGAWTATGWPATLEGAVLSGHAAARAALAALEIDGETTYAGAVAAPGGGVPGVLAR
jgi:hydroxysqualene dehydroxylase